MPLKGRIIGFIGAGSMGEALIKSLAGVESVSAGSIWASDLNASRLSHLNNLYGINTTQDNRELVRKADVVIYCVKPFALGDVLSDIAPHLPVSGIRQLHISIAAGIPLGFIEGLLPEGVPVVRVMPNTPSLVGAGAAAYAPGKAAGPEDEQTVREILDSAGVSVKVPEHLMNAVTGLSGSGPAYVFLILEALIDGGVKAGLPRDTAAVLATQTLLGSAQLVKETGEHPARLKDMVTTPGGTTIAGLHALEEGRLRATIMDAVLAATRRAEELGKSK